MDKFYYLGEFGYFNFSVLGLLEKYLKKATNITICTYPDYAKILKHVFKEQYIEVPIPEQAWTLILKNRDNLRRGGNTFADSAVDKVFKDNNFKELSSFLNSKGRKSITNINQPIIKDIIHESKKYISISCRKRVWHSFRNITEDNWKYIINSIRSFYEFSKMPIVFHGLREESLVVQIDNSIMCNDILDAIYYLNNSAIFIASMSGYAQFASNCGCNTLQIGPKKCDVPYDPFKSIKKVLEPKDLNSIKSILAEYLKSPKFI